MSDYRTQKSEVFTWLLLPTLYVLTSPSFTHEALLKVPAIFSTLLRTVNIVAHRPIARQRHQNKQRVQLLLCNRQLNKQLFLINNSVNTFPWKRDTIQLQWKRGCFLCGLCQGVKKKTIGAMQFSCQLKVSLWREDQEVGVKWPPAWVPVSWALWGRLRRDGAIAELTVDKSSAWVAVTRGPENRKLRISTVRSHCQETSSEDWEDLVCTSDL
jgi:hypothetical protein